MAVTIGAGIGGSCIIAPQATWGGSPSFGSARTIPVKSAKATHNQHPLQGGPYLRYGAEGDIGSARVILWLNAQMTMSGDMMSTGAALLLAYALGSTGTLTQLGTTPAYSLGGAGGISIGDPGANGTFLDCQLGVPDTTTATVHPWTYHSGYIQKSVWVFDKTMNVSYEYDLLFQFPETATGQTVPAEAGGPVPFNMAGTVPIFKMGTLGSEVTVDGIKKCTITLERKVATDRIYIGEQFMDVPVANDNAKVTVALDWDYTTNVNTSIIPLLISGAATSIVVGSVGPAIGSSGFNNTFQLAATNCFLDTGGEPTLDGPDIVKGTASFSGTIDAAGDPMLKATLITADTSF